MLARGLKSVAAAACLAAVVCLWSATAQADTVRRPFLHLNQDYLDDLNVPSALNIRDVMEVFGFVFSGLPDEVKVYPTENYFYFSFFHNGIEMAGNLRLDALDRDDGIVHFAYFMKYNRWNEDLISHYRRLDAKAGVTVERLERLVYKMTYEGRSVVFRLNDLAHVRPPDGMLSPDETYIGPMYDDSGLSFYFVYNRALKMFHYILNAEVSAAEIFLASRVSGDIVVGQRTSFAFYKDRLRERRILIGIYDGNAMVNNYFDGPFDQLPDNFIEGNTFHDILVHAFPDVEGQIDRFGNSNGGESRLLISPYIHYSNQSELAPIDACARAAGDDEAAYYLCFNTGQPDYSDNRNEASSADQPADGQALPAE